MAEAPVGRNTGTGTGGSGAPSGDEAAPVERIPVSEAPEVEPEQEQDEEQPAAAAPADADGEPAGKAAGGGFDVFASGAKPEPIPVSEEPDLEVEAAEAEAESAGERTTVVHIPASRVPVSEPEDAAAEEGDGGPDSADDEDDDAAAATMFVPAVGLRAGAAQAAESEAAAVAEADETTLIPKVTPERPTESTTVMPSVPSPNSADMARRPYGTAPSGYGSARQEWGQDLPDAQPTRVQPLIPGPAPAGGGSKQKKPGYQPPEFHAVDPQRSELPPPSNFKLDRREVEGEHEGGRRIARRALLTTGAVAVVAAGGLAAAGKLKLPGTAPTPPPTVGFAPASSSGASPATQTGTAFLTAWQNNELKVAANLTDSPAEALAALEMYHKNLGVLGITMNPNAANGVGYMTFAITTEAGSPMGQWQYQSGFAAYDKQIDGFVRWFVQWSPQILYSALKPGYQLQIKHTPASVKGLVDRNNKPIDPTAHPSLANVVNALVTKAKATGATDGQDIIMVDDKGSQLATVATLTPPIDNGTVATTLDMNVQAACESASTYYDNSAIVAIQPSTGHILAVANHNTSQYVDTALTGTRAPGSTFKIVTSTALLHNGLTTIDSTVPCPQVLDVDSTLLHNSEGESSDGDSYLLDFAASCNNAFSSFWDAPGMTPNLLADTAKTFYGLNQPWDIGLGEERQYMTVTSNVTGALRAETLVGQGDILSNPLAMCSVAATVANGSFKQPILLPKYKQIPATPLGSKLQGDLKDLMASVITEGTAAGVPFPHNGHFFGKTGTAELSPTENDSWFVVFHDQADIAVCALGVLGGYGATVAAHECYLVFRTLGYT